MINLTVMENIVKLDQIAINVKSHRVLKELLKENPVLEEIMRSARNETEALVGIKNWISELLEKNTSAYSFYKEEVSGREAFEKLSWKDYAAIRLLDYVDNAGRSYEDQTLRGEKAVTNPIKMIWLAVTYGTGGAKPAFFEDMLYLFRQLSGTYFAKQPSPEKILSWMERFPSGVDPRIIKLREENRDRIINVLIGKIERGEIEDKKYFFEKDLSAEQKFLKMLGWWKEHLFHLRLLHKLHYPYTI